MPRVAFLLDRLLLPLLHPAESITTTTVRNATAPLSFFFSDYFFSSSSILCLRWNGRFNNRHRKKWTGPLDKQQKVKWRRANSSNESLRPFFFFLFFSFFAVVLFSILPMFYYLNAEMGGLLLSWFRIFDGRLNGWSPYLYFNCSWWVSRFKAKDPQFSNKRETDGNFHFLAPVEGQFSFLLRVLVERKERESINI
jgi:hypothetical protein